MEGEIKGRESAGWRQVWVPEEDLPISTLYVFSSACMLMSNGYFAHSLTLYSKIYYKMHV